MSGTTIIKESTGLAICAICGKRIEKGTKQINFSAWNGSSVIHSNEKECGRDKWG